MTYLIKVFDWEALDPKKEIGQYTVEPREGLSPHEYLDEIFLKWCSEHGYDGASGRLFYLVSEEKGT